MKIILVVLGLVLLLPRRSSGTFLRHVVEGGGGRILQACEQDCQYNKCAVEGKAECLKEAEKTAYQKYVWCVEQNGNYKKWQDTVCGATLKENGEQEIDCSMFSSCVAKHNCDEYDTFGCDKKQSEAKAEWAFNTCKTSPVKADQWKQFCPIDDYQMDSVCDDFRGCMTKVAYKQNIEKKLDFKISTCMSENRFEGECSANCETDCPCKDTEMMKCAVMYDKCKADDNSKKCFKNLQEKSFKGCCCSEKNCADPAEGFEKCEFLVDYNRAGSGPSGDSPLPADSCTPNPCENGATCLNDSKDAEGYECICREGFSGDDCEVDVDPCTPNPCSHGTCTPLTAKRFVCDCDAGYEGAFCNKEINYCSPDPCDNGTCQNDPPKETYKCKCDNKYWTGKRCQRKKDVCGSDDPCPTFADCENDPDEPEGFKCTCLDGYSGENCDLDIGGEVILYRYACTRNSACRCYDDDCESNRGTYELYEQVTRGECEKLCNENGKCNGIEYNPNLQKCEVHTDGMMDRKENSSTMCCEKKEVSINRVPDSDCIMCTDEPTSWMSRNNKRCDNWIWGVTTGRRCNDTPENTEYPYWERNRFCELSCAKARGGPNYPDSPRCCQLEYLE